MDALPDECLRSRFLLGRWPSIPGRPLGSMPQFSLVAFRATRQTWSVRRCLPGCRLRPDCVRSFDVPFCVLRIDEAPPKVNDNCVLSDVGTWFRSKVGIQNGRLVVSSG